MFMSRALWIEVLHTQQETRALRACEQPREQGRTEIPEVKRAGGGGCEAAVDGFNPGARMRRVEAGTRCGAALGAAIALMLGAAASRTSS